MPSQGVAAKSEGTVERSCSRVIVAIIGRCPAWKLKAAVNAARMRRHSRPKGGLPAGVKAEVEGEVTAAQAAGAEAGAHDLPVAEGRHAPFFASWDRSGAQRSS